MIGTGILKGMAVTARNFVGSYFDKERLITVQYPEERNPRPKRRQRLRRQRQPQQKRLPHNQLEFRP
jgi:hypothetical protein